MRALKRVEGINVVPLIDVVLVLLAIVLTISTFVASGAIKLDLPKAASAIQTPPQKIEIAINENGSLFWNGKEMSKEELNIHITALTIDSSVSILGDKKAFFNDFIFILDQLKRQKIEKISIVTKRDV
ncbi:MAG: biopolymer transporter ExbD [Sulfuricurvum sp.]|uniref:biopolymer transporter ExbD n=1 Tax=Sulfuricurvum sp. TaxID=2025608 RepID=UPI0027192994|nr:biopolymer transporter ExbD [Sulfuricurvum sp.]MDO9055998.1 biopolymer transporter ExbD [Sulfuricurvum sp.]MDP3292026.1 biopolymer transporter ExbD [Sulfuricurvum sp.]